MNDFVYNLTFNLFCRCQLPARRRQLLPELGDECRIASERAQLLVTTHSPFFLNTCRADEIRILYRDERGFTQATTASEIVGINEFVKTGASLGHLWMEGQFGMSDPLKNQGAPRGTAGNARGR